MTERCPSGQSSARCSTALHCLTAIPSKNSGRSRLAPVSGWSRSRGVVLGVPVKTILVLVSLTVQAPKTQRQVDDAKRVRVPVFRRFDGLAITPTDGTPGFTLTHVNTGLAIPGLSGLTYEEALQVGAILDEAFPWRAVVDVFFHRELPPSHLGDLCGCIVALREMFGVAVSA